MNLDLDKEIVDVFEQLTDVLTHRGLKSMFINTYLYTFHHQEDLENNLKVREACKELLRYCMVSVEAEDFINEVEKKYGSNLV